MAKKKTKAVQITVYDLGDNPLSDKLIQELEGVVVGVLKQHTTVAHLVARA